MHTHLFTDSDEIAAIQLQIDWKEYIAKELPGLNFVPELTLLEKRKMEVVKKSVAEEIAMKYPDLALARAVRHNRAQRKATERDENGKRFKKIASERLRMTLALNKMKMKAMELETRVHKERMRLERSAGIVDKKEYEKISPSNEKRAASQEAEDSKQAKKTRCH